MSIKKATIPFLAAIAFSCLVSACASTQGDWQKATDLATTAAYEDFLLKHPDSEQAELARNRLLEVRAEQDWQAAEDQATIAAYTEYLRKWPDSAQASEAENEIAVLQTEAAYDSASALNTIEAYEQFLEEHPHATQGSDARKLLDKLQSERDWDIASADGAIEAYRDYLERYPTSGYRAEAKGLLEGLTSERDWSAARSENTSDAYRAYLRRHPSSQYEDEAKQALIATSFAEARNSGDDEALIAFIVSQPDHPLASEAAAMLKGHKMHRGGYLVPADSLPTVWARGAGEVEDLYPCGVDLARFSRDPIFDLRGEGAVVGSIRLARDDESFLRFYDDTRFDGYIVYGVGDWARAKIKREGLDFFPGSIIFERK